jgi:hypothetical protein
MHAMDQQEHRIALWSSTITVRLSGPHDLPALERLAGLDSCRLPAGPHLVAERDGRIEAALSLQSHELVADPFRRTAELGELLRCHAGDVQVNSEPRQARLKPRSLPVPA